MERLADRMELPDERYIRYCMDFFRELKRQGSLFRKKAFIKTFINNLTVNSDNVVLDYTIPIAEGEKFAYRLAWLPQLAKSRYFSLVLPFPRSRFKADGPEAKPWLNTGRAGAKPGAFKAVHRLGGEERARNQRGEPDSRIWGRHGRVGGRGMRPAAGWGCLPR
jgi:hypothetical protein